MWPRKPTYWMDKKVLNISIPFTWNLPGVLAELHQKSFCWDHAFVGGPAVQLMPGFFDNLDYVTAHNWCKGVLQRVNPLATRTTLGCIRRCGFCAIGTGRIEGNFKELDYWPDFNQGLDSRLLTDYHAARLKEIKKPTIRLALDHMDYRDQWQEAFDRLREAGIAKRNISSYCLVGFGSDPRESWQRCEWVESHGVKAYPMWYHSLDQLQKNIVTDDQRRLGWTDAGRKEIMGYYYKHRGLVPNFAKEAGNVR